MYISFNLGGSSGLGLALAKLLLARGADVTIIARNQGRLDAALTDLKVRSFLYRLIGLNSHSMSFG